jgi:hypothetical protein
MRDGSIMPSAKIVAEIRLTGRIVDDWFDDDLDDGDIQLQAVLDSEGKWAIAGGHSNYGYSGYFRGYVWLDGARKRLVDWWTLFPGKEHHYATQGDKRKAAEAIQARIDILSGTAVQKVKGGYAFDPQAHLDRQEAKRRPAG